MVAVVELNYAEMLLAANLGCVRRVSSIYKKRDDHADGNIGRGTWTSEIYGAAGEMAFAKLQNVYYVPTVDTFKAPDVGPYQVRSTEYASGYLSIRLKDNDEEPFVLVTCDPPRFTIVGWILAKNGKNASNWADPGTKGLKANGPGLWQVQQRDLIEINGRLDHA